MYFLIVIFLISPISVLQTPSNIPTNFIKLKMFKLLHEGYFEKDNS